ncbi:MAG: hypothetical protein KDK03_09785 [Rhodobacteraceae bacterium]|nr:hypothetical protein [Paracoccaceae bacterium]
MTNTFEPNTIHLSVAAALKAARIASRRIGHGVFDPVQPDCRFDLEDLAARLIGATVLDAITLADLGTLIRCCEARVAEGTGMKAELMPGAVSGEDVLRWDEWTRPVRTPEAERLHAAIPILQACLESYEQVCDLADAEAAFEIRRLCR